MANSASGESIIGRFVRIVSAFDDRHPSMSVAELGRRTGLPVTTTYRLVNDLLLERLLEREPGGEVHIGTRMWELVSRGLQDAGPAGGRAAVHGGRPGRGAALHHAGHPRFG